MDKEPEARRGGGEEGGRENASGDSFFVLFLSRALPFVLDSDEEVMTTRFESSKMN